MVRANSLKSSDDGDDDDSKNPSSIKAIGEYLGSLDTMGQIAEALCPINEHYGPDDYLRLEPLAHGRPGARRE